MTKAFFYLGCAIAVGILAAATMIAGLGAAGAAYSFVISDAGAEENINVTDYEASGNYISETETVDEVYPLKFCPICQKEGRKSKIYVLSCGGSVTALNCGNGHYDEDGHYHPPEDCNTYTMWCEYLCSNDHSWSESE